MMAQKYMNHLRELAMFCDTDFYYHGTANPSPD